MSTKVPLMGSLAAAVLLALITLAGSNQGVNATHIPATSLGMAVDADVNGNTATSLGTREDCVSTTAGGTVTIDVTVEGIPAVDTKGTTEPADDTGGIIGFTFSLVFDPVPLSITSSDPVSYLLGSNAGSNVFSFDEPVPDPFEDNYFLASNADFGTPPGATESGSGVLDRITIEVDAAAADGLYPLYLFDAVHLDAKSINRLAPALYGANIAVGSAVCAAPAPPPPGIVGDVDCTGTVNAIDALKVLRNNAGLLVAQTEPCTDVGISTVANETSPVPRHIGDVDCSGAVNAIDALKVLRKNANLPVTQTEPCDDIGT